MGNLLFIRDCLICSRRFIGLVFVVCIRKRREEVQEGVEE